MKWSPKVRENALIFKEILPNINSLRDQSGVSHVRIGSLNRGDSGRRHLLEVRPFLS